MGETLERAVAVLERELELGTASSSSQQTSQRRNLPGLIDPIKQLYNMDLYRLSAGLWRSFQSPSNWCVCLHHFRVKTEDPSIAFGAFSGQKRARPHGNAHSWASSAI